MDINKVCRKNKFGIACEMLLFLLVLITLTYCFPVVGDDFYWTDGSRKIESVSSFFRWAADYWETVNGRILGNIFGLWVKQSTLFRALVRASIIWLIVFLVYKNSGMKSRLGYGITFIYVLAVPAELFSQTYAWSCGYFNYVPPVFLILLYFYILQSGTVGQKGILMWLKVFVVLFLGICSQLFVENVTLYLLLVSVCISVCYAKKNKKTFFLAISHTIGAVIGTVFMFSSPGYRSVVDATDTYRQIPTGIKGMLIMARNNWCEISRYAIRENLLLVCTMAVLCLFVLFRKDGERKYFIIRRINSILIAGTSCYFFIVTYLLEWDSKIETYTIFALLDVAMCAMFFVSVFMTVILFIDNKRSRYVSLFYLVSALITIVPLLVVSPIGARCFYASYIFSVISVLTLFAYIVKKGQWKVERIWFPICVVIVCVIGYYLYIFWNIKEVEVERDAYIVERMEEGDSVIEVPEFPYSEYLHEPHGWKIQLKYYYEEAGDIEFLFIPYSEWKEEKKNYR